MVATSLPCICGGICVRFLWGSDGPASICNSIRALWIEILLRFFFLFSTQRSDPFFFLLLMAKSFPFPFYFLPFFFVLFEKWRKAKEGGWFYIIIAAWWWWCVPFPAAQQIHWFWLLPTVHYKTAAYYYCSFGLNEIFGSLHPLTLMIGPKVIYITRYNTELARLFIFGTNINILCICVSSFAGEMLCIV
jgi:hypothetical protein